MKKLRTKKIGLLMLLISLFSSGIMSLIALSGFLTNVSSYIKNPVFAGSQITAHSMRAPGLYNDHWRLIESWDNIKNQFGVRTIKGVENSLYLKTESLEGILIVGNLDLEYTSLNSCFAGQDKLSAIYFRDSFNTSNVTNFAHMFSDCCELNKVDISNFDTSNYEDGKEPLPIPVPSVVPTAGIRLDNNIFMLALSAGASIISIVGVCLLLINKKRFMLR